MKTDWKKLILYILIPLAAGGLSGWISKNGMNLYETLNQPPLAPPGWLFPVVWTLLFVLMGVSSYRIAQSASPQKKDALQLYGLQLIVNFLWSPVFFLMKQYLLALIILIILWLLILKMILLFRSIDPLAGRLQLPYLIWVSFAGYLNLGVWLLNR